jgi:hypothetical protein
MKINEVKKGTLANVHERFISQVVNDQYYQSLDVDTYEIIKSN